MDALSDVLRAVRLTGAIFFDVRATAPWVAETPAGPTIVAAMFPGSEHLISYHVITAGSCWACVPGEAPMALSAGDIILLPHGDTHVLSSTPGLRRSPEMSMYRYPSDGKLPVTIAMGGNGDDGANGGAASGAGASSTAAPPAQGGPTQFVCGFLGCDARPYNPLLAALPRVIRVSDKAGGTLATFVQLALAESKQPRIGGQSVLSRLSELMFMDAIRLYLETLPVQQTNWLAGLRDSFVGKALAALHRRPEHCWTIESIAQEVGLSRSALAERFTEFVGKPPMQYLASWRMQLAANHLLSGSESVAAVAERVGYDSEAAFSRAFKKAVGTPPGDFRKQRRSAA